MSGTTWVALTVATVGAVVLTYLHRRHVARVQRDRAALFEHAIDVLEQCRIVPRGLDFPLLYGRFEGRDVRVEPVVDALALRVVPVLRLMVTVRAQFPGQPTLSVLSNETGHEFFSGHRQLLRWRDPSWPEWASVACAAEGVDRELADAAVSLVTEDSVVKQVLVTEGGPVRRAWRTGEFDGLPGHAARRSVGGAGSGPGSASGGHDDRRAVRSGRRPVRTQARRYIGGGGLMNRPIHPLLVLGIAMVLPGVGQVVNGQPRRGLVFVFYTLLLGVVTYLVAPAEASAIGRVAGGVFVYALSLLDAYQVAARRRYIATNSQ
jgi:hypothetical protein